MLNLVMLANCQGPALAKTLLEDPEFRSAYSWTPLPPIQSLTDNDVGRVVSAVRMADLFIYQPISESPNRSRELSSNFLLGQLSDSAVALSFPSLYFDGYFPHLGRLAGYSSPLKLVHDYVIAFCFASGFSVDQTQMVVQDSNLYPESLSSELAETSLRELERREQSFNTSVKISTFVRDNFRKDRLFNQFNHPTRIVFDRISTDILRTIDLKKNDTMSEDRGYLDLIRTPVYRSTYRNLNLTFEENFDHYRGMKGREFRQIEVIREFFNAYADSDKNKLRKQVVTNKPFIEELVTRIS